MSYSVKELYYTLQGEGAHAGRAAVFCRFAGCNLWTGREADRSSAVCQFCDTDFVGVDGPGGGTFPSAQALAEAAARCWPAGMLAGGAHSASLAQSPSPRPLVVLTGGEPALQVDEPLVAALHAAGFEIAIETNGTRPLPPGIDWICVSPKVGAEVVVRTGDELKLVYPQPPIDPADFESWDFTHHFLQPMDGPDREENTRRAAAYCLAHPRWRLSLQLHKLLGLP